MGSLNTLFSKEMVRLIMSHLQVGDDAPCYQLLLKRPEEFYTVPKKLEIPYGGVTSIDVTGSREYGCRNATIELQDVFGLTSPEFGVSKHAEDAEDIADDQPNNKQRFYSQLLAPETWIQISLGYGQLCIPVLTGAIDEVEVNSKDAKILIRVRCNMRYLVDQTIDALKHGAALVYPRTDNLVRICDGTTSQSESVLYVKVRGADPYVNARVAAGSDHEAIGKAYNGQIFQYIGEAYDELGGFWYQILFNGEQKWLPGYYIDVIHSNELVSTKAVVRVDKTKTTHAHLHVHSGPSIDTPEIAQIGYLDNIVYLGQAMSNYGNVWFNVSYNGGSGWIYNEYAGIEEGGIDSFVSEFSSGRTRYIDYHNHVHVKESASSASSDIGEIYDGNTYNYLQTMKVDGIWWHQFSFHTDSGDKVGWLSNDIASLEQHTNIISYHTVVEITGVTTHLHIRSGPDTSYSVLKEVSTGDLLSYLGSNTGTDKSIVWHHVLFNGATGSQEGYVYGKYTTVRSGSRSVTDSNPDTIPDDPTVMVDATITIDAAVTKWTAAAIVHDLAVEATHIYSENGIPYSLDRMICLVMTSEYTVEDDGEVSRYVMKQKTFKNTQSYFDCAMEIVNYLGNVTFRCNRYGDIELFRRARRNQASTPDWVVHDYVDITSANLKYAVQDMKNRVIIISDHGTSLFEYPGFTSPICKGVNRTMSMKVPWAQTVEQRCIAATEVFSQMLSNWRKMDIVIVGNPLIDVDDVIRLDDMTTTAVSLYRVLEYRHNFTEAGFLTSLSLEWVAQIQPCDILFVSENFPSYMKRFTYSLSLAGNPRPIKIKMPSTITKARIGLYDASTKALLAIVETTGDTYVQDIPSGTTAPTTTYIILNSDDVYLRTSPDVESTSFKRSENAGFSMKFIREEQDFYYIGSDPQDGQEVYVWKAYCSLQQQTGTSNPALLGSSGDVTQFLQIALSKVGCGYLMGAHGQICTEQVIVELENQWGYENYHKGEADAYTWIGTQVFDCCGLVCWILHTMNLLSSDTWLGPYEIFNSLCYEISGTELRPGDLFFRQPYQGKMTHVGIYIGNGQDVEAATLAMGVIQGALPQAERFGRLKVFSNGASYVNTVSESPVISNVPVYNVPNWYSVSTSFEPTITPPEVLAKIQELSGNLLYYKDGCVLYNVGVGSNGGQMNELELDWAPVDGTPRTINMEYDILIY